MKFNKSFCGYSVRQVDGFVKAQQDHFEQVTTTQKQRIFQLSDENDQLKSQLLKYQQDEQAVKSALAESRRTAAQLQADAERYSNLVLQRAKLFYATWQVYAKTMLNGLSPQETAQFADLLHQMEDLMASFGEMPTSSQDPMLVNPVTKTAKVAQPAIDLAELLKPQQTLHEMCTELGLI